MGGSSWCISSGSLVMVLVVIMVAPLTHGEQPEECMLYKVTSDIPSPTLDVPGKNSETYISLDLLFANATASVNISDGDTSSCQITVDMANGTMEGDCFGPKEIPLRCSETGGLNTIVLMRNGPVLVVHIHGDNSDSKVLILKAPNPDKSIQVQVNSDTIINTAFNCHSYCFQFSNAIIHSKYNLTLSALQTGIGNDVNVLGVIKVLHGEEWNNNTAFNFTSSQYKGDDGNRSKKFYVASKYTNITDSVNLLGVSGPLIGENVPKIVGEVPSLDTYLEFEDMETIRWTVCEKDPTKDSDATNVDFRFAKGDNQDLVTEVTTEMTTVNETESANTYPITNIHIEETTTIKREIEELSCKDTWEPICTLRNETGGACNCAEAKANGLCENLDDHPYAKDNCNKTCGLCPDQVPYLPVTADISSGDINEAGATAGISEGTPKPDTPHGGIAVYVILGVVGTILLMLLIWILLKKKRTSRTLDLEGQSQAIAVKESTETDTDMNKKQDQDANNKGAENIAFQEQDNVKKDAEIVDEKVNKDDINKTIKDSSPVSNETFNTKDDSDNKAAPITNDKVHKPEAQKTTGDGIKTKDDNIDDGLINKTDEDKLPQEDNTKDNKIEKEDELEKKNENVSKDIDDNLENQKV